jgi:poly(A) polymerase
VVRPLKHPVRLVLVVSLGHRSGTVESKLRQLVMKLEYVESLVIAHPFIKGFDQEVYCLTDEEVRAVAEGEISAAVLKRKKEDCEGKEGRVVYTTTFYIGLAIEPKPGGSPVS